MWRVNAPSERAAGFSQRGRSGRGCCRKSQGETGGRSRLESARRVRLLPENAAGVAESTRPAWEGAVRAGSVVQGRAGQGTIGGRQVSEGEGGAGGHGGRGHDEIGHGRRGHGKGLWTSCSAQALKTG